MLERTLATVSKGSSIVIIENLVSNVKPTGANVSNRTESVIASVIILKPVKLNLIQFIFLDLS